MLLIFMRDFGEGEGEENHRLKCIKGELLRAIHETRI
jgi:hypothetical protein